jgi:hypothetical protein
MLTNLMNKLMVLTMAGVMLGLGGCASISPTKVPTQISGTANHAYKLARDGSGVLYGVIHNSGLNHDITTARFACDAINNSDERCSHPDDYVVRKVVPNSEFNEGLLTIVVLMEKDKAIEPCWNFSNNKTCTYVKIKTEKNKLGTVLEIVSIPGDDKCHWSLGAIGGVVCPGWSYSEVRHFTASQFALTGVDAD